MPGPEPDDPSFDGDSTIIGDQPVMSILKSNKRPPRLEQAKGPGAPRVFALLNAEVIVGRAPQADVSIQSGMISRKHMVLKRNGLEFTFTDLESANGVMLNGVKAHSAVLHEGDTLQVGDVVFIFHEGD
jgi:pSer/pThr/pTyr-binding forkhead associated (FHA) protein